MESKYEMNLKRALKLLNMPGDWFNTAEKMELRNKAVEFIGKNEDVKNLYYGRITEDDRLGAVVNAERKFEKDKENIPKLKEAIKAIELEGEKHGLDHQMLDIISRCKSKNLPEKSMLEFYIKDDAIRNIRQGRNCAESYMYELGRDENENHVTSLQAYERYVERKLEQLEDKKLKKDPEIEKLKEALNDAKRKIEELKSKVQVRDDFETYSRSIAFEPLLRKQQKYDESLKRVCAQLGFDINSKEEMNKVEAYVQNIVSKGSSHDKDYMIGVNKQSKQTPNYRTKTEKITEEPKKEDDGYER